MLCLGNALHHDEDTGTITFWTCSLTLGFVHISIGLPVMPLASAQGCMHKKICAMIWNVKWEDFVESWYESIHTW